jgi:hypothetical protein
MVKKQIIFDTIDDLVESFLWSDRKEDEELGRGEIEASLEDGDITIDEMVERFKNSLTEGLR